MRPARLPGLRQIVAAPARTVTSGASRPLAATAPSAAPCASGRTCAVFSPAFPSAFSSRFFSACPSRCLSSRPHLRPRNPHLRMASTLSLPRLPVFEAIAAHDPDSEAVAHCLSGRTFKYGGLLADVSRARDRIYAAAGTSDIQGERVAFLVENGYDYVVTFLAILAARAIALPLSPPFPAPELQYILSHSEARLLLHSPKYAAKAGEVLETLPPYASPDQAVAAKKGPTTLEMPKHVGSSTDGFEAVSLSEGSETHGAGMMLYTSGTTNRPKGVLLPESALTAQSRSLIEAWRYSPADRLLHVLPLHHIHGTVNALLTPLFAGSTIEFLFPFNADAVWRRLANPFLEPPPAAHTNGVHGTAHAEAAAPTDDKYACMSRAKITFFTVVPTVYTRLLATHKDLPPDVAEAGREAASPAHMRVAISGSAALPTPVKRAWRDLSRGTVLLERYGMTEVGMALSCGLHPADRVDASVGWPLPGVEARLVDTDTGRVIPPPTTTQATQTDEPAPEPSGEIQLRGPTIFREYWRNPSATASEFVPADDGGAPWFKTGDVAVQRAPRRKAVVSATLSGEGATPPAAPLPGSSTDVSGAWASGPLYYILGRQSADIIKSGGEKVSALEVEREMLSLPEVAEAAVVAVPSGKWGHKVGAIVVLSPDFARAQAEKQERQRKGAGGSGSGSGSDSGVGLESDAGGADAGPSPQPPLWRPMDMRRALRGRLANYKIPQVLRVLPSAIPRNAMGKVNKKELVKQIFRDDFSGDEM